MNVRATRLLSIIALLTALSVALGGSGGDYDLSWRTVDAGGGAPVGGVSYTSGSTIGQPDAGVLQGDTYTLVGGFWGRRLPPEWSYYYPLMLKGYP